MEDKWVNDLLGCMPVIHINEENVEGKKQVGITSSVK